MCKIFVFLKNMKSQHAVSTNKTLTFCGAKNILGEKKLNHKKIPKKLNLYCIQKPTKIMSKLKAQNSHLAILCGLLEINKNLSSDKCKIFFSPQVLSWRKIFEAFLYFLTNFKTQIVNSIFPGILKKCSNLCFSVFTIYIFRF